MKKLLLVFLLAPWFLFGCSAEALGGEVFPEIYQVEQALPEGEREISGELRLDGSYDAPGALKRLWQRAREKAEEQLHRELRFALQLVSIALLCSLGGALNVQKEAEDVINLAGCCTVSLLLAGELDGLVGQASQTLTELSDYSRAAMPVLFTAAGACGAPASSAAKYGAACFVIDFMIGTAHRLLLPVIHAFIALAVSRSIYENALLNSLLKLLKWCSVTAMTVLTMGFTFYLSLSGLVAGSTDALAVKTAKTVISRTLPVVGGILSDSAAVVLAAAGVIRNTAGAFCMVAVCALCLGPFVALSVKMLVYKAAAVAADFLPGGRLSRLIGDIGTAYGMLLGLIGSCGIMLLVSIMSGIRVVSG